MLIGILALQGGIEPHHKTLHRLAVSTLEVRSPAELSRCDGLILPGGESTTLMRQLEYAQLLQPLSDYRRPLFATCAGLIICSKSRIDRHYSGLSLLDIEIERNAYGTQTDSFAATLSINGAPLNALFIRAPKIAQVGAEVQILATHQSNPVIISQGLHLGATCHPELTASTALHQLFVERCMTTRLMG